MCGSCYSAAAVLCGIVAIVASCPFAVVILQNHVCAAAWPCVGSCTVRKKAPTPAGGQAGCTYFAGQGKLVLHWSEG